MLEAAILGALHLSPDQARVHVLSRPSAWNPKGPHLCVPRALGQLLSEAAPRATKVAFAVPVGPCNAILRLFVVDLAAVAQAAATAGPRKANILVQTPGPVCDPWAYLPPPTLQPPAGVAVMSVAEIEQLLARALQATAEWHFFATAEGGVACAAEKTAARLLNQYGGDSGAQADTFFALLVLPYARGARLPSHALLRKLAHESARLVVVAWNELPATESLGTWIAAGRAQAAAFERAAPLDQVERLRRAALETHAATFRRLLPPQALAWLHESRAWAPGTPADPLTQLASEGASGFVRDWDQLRADIGRWAIVNACLRPPPSGPERAHWVQLRQVAGPFVGSWDEAVASRQWAVLALTAARHSGLRLVQAGPIEAAVNLIRETERRRRAIALYWRDHGGWERPGADVKEQAQRFAALGATTPERLRKLFGGAWVPPCIQKLITRGHGKHHLTRMDRFALASWLVALQPVTLRDARAAPGIVQMLAEFALGPTAEQEAVDSMCAAVTQAIGERGGLGPACNGIIGWTLKPPDERHACRCPYAKLRTGKDNSACAKACVAEAAEKGPKVPLTYHPMHRLLWAKETGLVEW